MTSIKTTLFAEEVIWHTINLLDEKQSGVRPE
jgi:hypothetical protein